MRVSLSPAHVVSEACAVSIAARGQGEGVHTVGQQNNYVPEPSMDSSHGRSAWHVRGAKKANVRHCPYNYRRHTEAVRRPDDAAQVLTVSHLRRRQRGWDWGWLGLGSGLNGLELGGGDKLSEDDRLKTTPSRQAEPKQGGVQRCGRTPRPGPFWGHAHRQR